MRRASKPLLGHLNFQRLIAAVEQTYFRSAASVPVVGVNSSIGVAEVGQKVQISERQRLLLESNFRLILITGKFGVCGQKPRQNPGWKTDTCVGFTAA